MKTYKGYLQLISGPERQIPLVAHLGDNEHFEVKLFEVNLYGTTGTTTYCFAEDLEDFGIADVPFPWFPITQSNQFIGRCWDEKFVGLPDLALSAFIEDLSRENLPHEEFKSVCERYEIMAQSCRRYLGTL